MSGESSSMDNEIAEFIENDAMNRIYLRHAYQYAQSYSKEPNTQLGAILVKPSVGVVGWGVNALIGFNSESGDRWEDPERNVIYKCAERGICTTGLIMYCPWFTSVDSARAIVQSGISAVVGHKRMYDVPWRKTSTENGISILKDCGILTKIWDGEIGNKVSIRSDGDILSP